MNPLRARTAAVLLLATSAGLAGCASHQLSDNERWARELRVLDPSQLGSRSYDEIGVLLETEPIHADGEAAAISTAKNRLRLRAAELDGDAVVIGFCERGVDPDDPATRLRPTVVCEGLVIRWLSR